MKYPKILLYSQKLEVTVGLYAFLADYCDVEIARNFDEAAELFKKNKFNLFIIHSGKKIFEEAKEEYRTLIKTRPNLPCFYLSEFSENVLPALRLFIPTPSMSLGYPLTDNILKAAVEKTFGRRLKKKPLDLPEEKKEYPQALIISLKSLDGITAKAILEDYCDVVLKSSTLSALKHILKNRASISFILVSSEMASDINMDYPDIETTFEYMRKLAPNCPAGWISWKKKELQKPSLIFNIQGGLYLDGKEGFKPEDLVKYVSGIIGFTLAPINKEKKAIEEAKKKKILVVDDEKGMRDSLAACLRFEYDILLAVDEEEALRIFKEDHLNLSLVLLDLSLKGRSNAGAYALLEMKKINRSIPVILMTGYNIGESIAQTFYLAVADILIKPFEKEILEEKIKEAIFTGETFQRFADDTMKMLVIDDSKETMDLMNLLFLDYNVVEADCGRTGIERAKREKFDIVILDYRLPDINGLEVLKQIRTIDKGMRVIAVTVDKNVKVAEAFIKEGAEKILFKPLKRDEVEAVVRSGEPKG